MVVTGIKQKGNKSVEQAESWLQHALLTGVPGQHWSKEQSQLIQEEV